MKPKIIIVVLAVVCVALVIALVATQSASTAQHVKDTSSITDFSNQLVTVNKQVTDLGQVNLTLNSDLKASREQTGVLSNNLITAAGTLASTKSALASRQEQVGALTSQVSDLNTQITDLEAKNKTLDERAAELTNQIGQLNAQIAATQDQLTIAQTNNAFLQAELKRQIAARAELERQFNDLNTVRAQYKKLKDEAFVQRRIELDRNTNLNKKGAQILNERTPPTPANGSTKAGPKPAPNYDLNVEVGSDGSVKIIPPMTTNSAAH
ncbi:MAG TPA: hypothetical protein VGO57_13095 [Verrucomicrobiae bacterium]|jgi:chromosome segregation ATPase